MVIWRYPQLARVEPHFGAKRGAIANSGTPDATDGKPLAKPLW
ncbi:hypothetical protein [Phormidium sp. CCY1219]|nr:hypothetical protein [Phormidium sp. CCY1219]